MAEFTLFPVSLTFFVCVSTNIRAFIVLAVTAIFLLTFSCPSSFWNGQEFPPHKDGNAPSLLNLPKVQTVKGFYRKRFDFLREGFKQTGSWVFQFNLLKHRVIAVSGEEGRQMILQEPGLDIYQGTQLVLESIPKGYHVNQIDSFYRRLLILQKSDNLTFMIPYLLSDCQRKMDTWGSQGLLDPRSAIYDITFVMIMRVLNTFDIADDLALVSRLKGWFDTLDSSSEPLLIHLPWIYGPARFRRIWAAANLYLTFKRIVRKRINGGPSRPDALQQLVDSNQTEEYTTRFMIALPLAGARSTGTIGKWLIMFLSSDPLWAAAVREEVQGLLSIYDISLPQSPSHEDLTNALSQVPLTAWETKMPHLDLCIRETMRISQPHTALRKNTGPDFSVGGYTIPSGAFVAYPFLDTCLNPSYYADPTRWNPSRLIQKDVPFIGWGMGKHMCKGQRLAILTMKLLTSSFVLRFDLSMVDERLEKMEEPPVPDYNDQLTCQPKDKCSIKFTERVF